MRSLFSLLACSLVMNACTATHAASPVAPPRLTRVLISADVDDPVVICLQVNAAMRFANPGLADPVCVETVGNLRRRSVESRIAND